MNADGHGVAFAWMSGTHRSLLKNYIQGVWTMSRAEHCGSHCASSLLCNSKRDHDREVTAVGILVVRSPRMDVSKERTYVGSRAIALEIGP